MPSSASSIREHTLTLMPSSASTIVLKPMKSMPITRSIFSPVSCWTALTVHAGPPTA